MSLLSNQLLNSMVSIKLAAIEHSSLFKPGVIEAIVMSSSPLLEQGKPVSQQFQISLQAQNRTVSSDLATQQQSDKTKQDLNKQALIEIISKQPLVIGSKIRLQLNPDNTAKILQIVEQNPQSSNKSSTTQTQAGIKTDTGISGQPSLTNVVKSSTATGLQQKHQLTNSVISQTAIKETPQVTLDQALRLALPQQQLLKTLLPLLLQLSQQRDSSIPKPILNNIKSLLASIPTPKQVQDPKQLKRSVLNSGNFLESKLNRLVIDQQNRNRQHSKLNPDQLAKLPSPAQYKQREAAIINADGKAKIQQIVRQIELIIGRPLSPQTAKSFIATSSSEDAIAKPLIDPTLFKNTELQTVLAQTPHNQAKQKDNIDIMLQQLGRQLLASLAKTQLNQLDSLTQKVQSNTEAPTNTNSWSLDIPIMHGKQIDHVEIKIQGEDSTKDQQKKNKQWQVMLDFDLHKLGKMSVELIIIEQTVSATVWSELEEAHLEVKKEIEGFRKGLEKIGVNVKKIDCKIGIPEKHYQHLQPLVDIRT